MCAAAFGFVQVQPAHLGAGGPLCALAAGAALQLQRLALGAGQGLLALGSGLGLLARGSFAGSVGFLGLLLGSSGAGFLLFLLGGAVAVNIGLLHTVKAAGAAGVIGGKLLCTTAGSFVLILIQRTACFHSTPGVHRARRVTSMVDIARRIAGVYPADLAHNVPPFYSNDGNWSFILFGYGTPAKGSACPFIGCRPRGHHPVRQRYRGPVGCLFRAQRQCFVPVHGTAPGPGSAFPRHAAPPHRGNPVRH